MFKNMTGRFNSILVMAAILLTIVFPLGAAAESTVISTIDFETAQNSGNNVKGKTSVGNIDFTILSGNMGMEGVTAKAQVVKTADYERQYPGLSSETVGSSVLMFTRTGDPSAMLRWNDVYNLSDTITGESYKASWWVYTADVEKGSSKEGTSALRFFVSKSGGYSSKTPVEGECAEALEIPNGKWTEISVIFKMTDEIKSGEANCFRMESYSTKNGYSWAKTIFIDNFTMQRAGSGNAGNISPIKDTQTSSDTDKTSDTSSDVLDSISAEIAGKKYENAIKVVSALGIMQGDETGKFAPEQKLTRAEALAIILRITGLSENLQSGSCQFADVPENHWAAGIIESGTKMGIVNGDGDGNFRPEDSVLVSETLKMVVCALGYEQMADDNGGYPKGCIYVGARLKLMDGVDAVQSDPILRWQCAQIVFNALEADLMIKKYGSTNNTSYIDKNSNILNYIFNTYKKNGRITSVPGTAFEGSVETEDNRVVIGGEEYITDIDLSSMIGKDIVYYVRYEKGGVFGKVVAYYELSGKNESLEIDFEDIISVTANTVSNVLIEYWKDDQQKQYSFKGSDYIYNNEFVSCSSVSELQAFFDNNMKQGVLRVVSNNEGDSMFIENYTAYVVDRINKDKKRIYYIKYQKTDSTTEFIDLSDSGTEYIVYDKYGAEIELDGLKEKDVISVYANLAKDKYIIYDDGSSVNGKIERLMLVKGSHPTDYQPPVEVTDYKKIYDKNYGDWNEAPASTYQLVGGERHNNSTERLNIMANGTGGTPPAGYNTPVHDVEKVSYLELASLTDNGNTADDEVYNSVIKDENGNIKTGNAVKQTVSANIAMARFVNLFDFMMPGTSEQPVRLKFKFDIYLTDIYDKYGMPDTDHSISELAVNTYIRAGSSDVQVKNITVPVNQWVTVETEYELTGNVADIHGLRIDMNSSSIKLERAYTTPFAGTVYYGGNLQVWMDQTFTQYPDEVEENCEYDVIIGGKTYHTSASFDDSLLLWSPLGIGSEVTFLLDRYGRIVGYSDTEKAKGNYGILMSAHGSNNWAAPAQVKILTASGELKLFDCADKISAFNGSAVVKAPLSEFITDSPSDPKNDWHIWSTNNEENFSATPRTWLTPSDKSNAASRKVVYYELNSQGVVTKIFVPSMPKQMMDSKITMLHDFNNFTATSSMDLMVLIKGFDVLMRANAAETPEDELMAYRIADDAIVFDVAANEYAESDYTVLKDLSSVPSGSYRMQLYSCSDDDVADIIVLNRQFMSAGSMTNVMVDSVEKCVEGYVLNGCYNGKNVSINIPENLRIMERLWYIDDSGTIKLTKDNIAEEFEKGTTPVCFSYEGLGMSTPYVGEAGLDSGDVVAVRMDDNNTANYVEVVTRACDGISLPYNGYRDTQILSLTNSSSGIIMGSAAKIENAGTYIGLNAYYWYSNIKMNSVVNKDKRSSNGNICNSELWYNIGGVEAVTIFDSENRNSVSSGSVTDIDEGDRVMIIGKSVSPSAVFVWKD